MYDQTPSEQFKGKGALDAFFNLFSLITLSWTSIAVGIILFQLIDKFLSPGTVSGLSRFSQSGLKFGVASALIVTPIFLLIINLLHKNYRQGNLNPQSGVYRWLTYLILLVAALNIIGRLIQLVFQLLNGDYTMSSILKIVVVLLIAGAIFGYYLYDLRRKDYSKRSNVSLAFFVLTIVVALASIIGSFFIIDTPYQARLKNFDRQRADDLSNLNSNIRSYFYEKQVLPSDLNSGQFAVFKDPATLQSYEYNILSEDEYELCATFSLKITTEDDDYRYYAAEEWHFHDAGYQCFKQLINEDMKQGSALRPVIVQ
ncbi:MAG: DUF5671 domain-containing protein [Patescibacteria group bacterium]|jgi:uncharacterized protein YneF (UPF0154 family)|nr:DUF5671 domain-containing protein [Patescibacteria group bacterium]